MRFRAKFGVLGWVYIAMAPFNLSLAFSPRLNSKLLAAFCAMAVAFKILTRIFVYWDVNPACLRERQFWREKNIPWQEVTRVRAQNPKRSAGFLAIDYARSASMSDEGKLLANPGDRQQFLESLRRYAPHAIFDLEANRMN